MREGSLKEALRELLLPIGPEREDAAVEAAAALLDKRGINPDDRVNYLRLERDRWRRLDELGDVFADAVRAYIRAGDEQLGEVLAKQYFQTHRNLLKKPRFDHETAAALLSHARLIASLARGDRLSAAQITGLLSQRTPGLPNSWQATEVVLSGTKSKPKLIAEDVKQIYDEDVEAEVPAFIDADDRECLEIIAGVARELGLDGTFAAGLEDLFREPPFVPYLKMLHYLCTIAERYDHPLEILYEFSPRGQACAWLSKQYPKSLGTVGNPFLNNAKSVDQLDRSWANSKKQALSTQAHALVTVVTELTSLSFAARREVAAWIRRLLVRRIRLEKGGGVRLPRFGAAQVEALLSAVRAGPTGTLGVLEQRVLDAVALLRHPAPVWVGRGLSDSVNTTNISRRKCGDCDFQDSGKRVIKAFEAHAGALSAIYVEDHSLTLERVLEARTRELQENFGIGDNWKVSVTFIANEIPGLPSFPSITVDGAETTIEATTFDDLLEAVDPTDPSTIKAFAEHVREPLQAARTPESVRNTVKALL